LRPGAGTPRPQVPRSGQDQCAPLGRLSYRAVAHPAQAVQVHCGEAEQCEWEVGRQWRGKERVPLHFEESDSGL